MNCQAPKPKTKKKKGNYSNKRLIALSYDNGIQSNPVFLMKDLTKKFNLQTNPQEEGTSLGREQAECDQDWMTTWRA